MDSLIFLPVVRVPLGCVLDLVFLEDFKDVVVSEVQRFVHGGVVPPVAHRQGRQYSALLHRDGCPASPGSRSIPGSLATQAPRH